MQDNIIDGHDSQIDPSSVSPRPTGMRYGLYLGGISVVLGLVSYLAGLNDPASPNQAGAIIIGTLSFIIFVGGIFLAVRHHRDQELGGFIKFGRIISLSFWVGLVNAAISAVWQFLFVTLIDPGFIDATRNNVVAEWEKAGMSEEQIEVAYKWVEATTSPAAMSIMALGGGIVMALFIGVVLGLFLKKDPPPMY